MTPIYYIAVFFVFHCFFLSKCGKILFAAKHGGGFFVFFGILPLQKKSGSRRRADFFARCGKGRKAASLLRRSPVFLRGALRITVRRAAFAAGGFFSHGAEKGRKAASLLRRSPVFLRGALRITVRRAAFAAGGFFRMGRKRAQSGKPFAGAARCFPWGFADYGSPSRFCGGGFFRMGRKRGAKR